jgi:carbon-monoxide dehydrogenase medium subunit
MTPFDYRRPVSLAEAVACLREDPDAKLLAGGQSLLPAIKLRLSEPSMLVDLQALPELSGIRAQGGGLWIGAMCSHASVAASPLVKQLAPMLAQLAGGIGDQQIRQRGTLGGSIANADPAACWPAGLMALNGTVFTDRRQLPSDEFFTGLFNTALAPDEVVLGVQFPCTQQAHYLKFEQPASRFALTGVAVAKQGRLVRVALTGLGSGVYRWADAERALTAQMAPQVLQECKLQPDIALGDIHASAPYRAHLAAVLTRRAVAHILETSV